MNISTEDVLRKFLTLELTKNNISSGLKKKINQCLSKNGDAFIVEIKQIVEKEGLGSPVFVYITGRNNDNRNSQIKRWEVANIEVKKFYTCGVNSEIDKNLKKVNWNIYKFSYKFARSCNEIKGDIPLDENRWVIGIDQKNNTKEGDIELIDGFHRLVPLILNEYKKVQTIIGRK